MKTWIEIEGRLYNLDMLVEVIPEGPQGLHGYHLKFCNGSFVKFTIVKPTADESNTKAVRDRYNLLVFIANAIRLYLYERTIQAAPGPYRNDREGDY